jgi:hypothetical protein
MHQSANLRTDLERASRAVCTASPDSSEFLGLVNDLSQLGGRITESIEDAFVELTCEQDEAA